MYKLYKTKKYVPCFYISIYIQYAWRHEEKASVRSHGCHPGRGMNLTNQRDTPGLDEDLFDKLYSFWRVHDPITSCLYLTCIVWIYNPDIKVLHEYSALSARFQYLKKEHDFNIKSISIFPLILSDRASLTADPDLAMSRYQNFMNVKNWSYIRDLRTRKNSCWNILLYKLYTPMFQDVSKIHFIKNTSQHDTLPKFHQKKNIHTFSPSITYPPSSRRPSPASASSGKTGRDLIQVPTDVSAHHTVKKSGKTSWYDMKNVGDLL